MVGSDESFATSTQLIPAREQENPMRDPDDKARQARFRAVLEGNLARLRCVARSYAREGEHEDLLQEMLVQIWRSLPTFQEHARLSTWVYRIALNTALASLRRRYRQPAAHHMAHEDLLPLAPSSVGDPVDMDVLLERFLATLEPVDRAVLMLSLDDLSYAEIADITGLSINAVGIRLNRIKQRFTHTYVEDLP
jgi:RNA polymerase sigma-70 factor (ECF subfamily)